MAERRQDILNKAMHLLIKIVQIFRKDDGTFLLRAFILPVASANIDKFLKNKKKRHQRIKSPVAWA